MENQPISPFPSKEEILDLGFGSVVARESRLRLLNRDGSFNVTRKGLGFWASLNLYHLLITIGWGRFFVVLTANYLFLNILFAIAYWLCGPTALSGQDHGLNSQFLQAFFFSVQTLSTIGYGHVSPVGLAANIIVAVESLVGILSVALTTGLLFARFSRPTARILFSQLAVIAPYRGITAFQFRITNQRSNEIIELTAEVLLSRIEMVAGKAQRRFYPLNLERERVAFFPLSWTIVHPIDQSSPLYHLTAKDLLACDAEFLILLTGIDETFSQTVHSRSSYKADELVWNAKYSNLFNRPKDHQPITIDVKKLDQIEPLNQLEPIDQ